MAKKKKKPARFGFLSSNMGYYDFDLVAVVLLLTCFGHALQHQCLCC